MRKTLVSRQHQELVSMLIKHRESAGLTQARLAQMLGEYQSFVARLESGQRRVDVIEFLELSKVLDFDPIDAIRHLQRVND